MGAEVPVRIKGLSVDGASSKVSHVLESLVDFVGQLCQTDTSHATSGKDLLASRRTVNSI